MKKIILGSFLSLAISFSAVAQNNAGADYLALGETKLAQSILEKQLSQSPAESYYYLGEIAFQAGNFAEAKANYDKGLAASPESALNLVGLAKLQLKSNLKDAESQLSSVQKKNKKDVTVLLAIAKAYLDNGMKEKALLKLADARKADKKSPWIYIFEGDMLAAENKPGDAAMQYDQAINFDPNCTVAYIKGAQVYEGINHSTAIDLLKKVTEIQPDSKITYKYLGKIYTQNGYYTEAAKAYQTYFEGGDYTIEDITRYASADYFSGNYQGAVDVIDGGLNREPNNFVLNRLLMYSQNELKDYDKALNTAQKFFSIVRTDTDTTKYIIQDFMTYGNILSETGQKVEAVEEYKKAIALDPTKVELNKEVATIFANEGMNAEAGEFYKKYIDLAGDKIESSDYFQLGRYYYIAGTEAARDSVAEVKAKSVEYLKEADTAFATVAERLPDNYLGYLWRARANASLDPDTEEGLAKPYYEEAVKVITAAEGSDNNRELIECYRYLSYYFYLQFDKSQSAEDKANTKLYSEKLLEIDPENSIGKQLLEVVK